MISFFIFVIFFFFEMTNLKCQQTVQGMNLAMSCLYDSLRKLSPLVEEIRLQCDGERRALFVFLTTDTGGPENLNYALFCLCGTLVAAGIFKTIIINRLPVGLVGSPNHALFISHFHQAHAQ